MKRFLLIATIASAMLTSCKKDKNEDQPKTNQEKIVGSWVSQHFQSYTYDKTNQDTLYPISFDGPLATFTFTSSGALYSNVFGSTDTSSYSINGNTLVMYSEDDTAAAEIKTLTDTQMIFEEKDDYTDGSKDYEDYTYVSLIKN